MDFRVRRRTGWVALNAFGMIAYLYLASSIWVLPGDDGLPTVGDAFYWLIILAPILALFSLLNGVALVVVVFRRRGRRRLIALGVWAAIALLWIATVAVDQQRSIHYVSL